MAVYGGYGRQLQEQNPLPPPPPSAPLPARVDAVNDPGRLRRAELHVSDAVFEYATLTGRKIQQPGGEFLHEADLALHGWLSRWKLIPSLEMPSGVILRFDVPETPAVDLSGNYLKSAPSLDLSPVPSAGTVLGSGKIIYGENPTPLVHETASQRAAKLWHALREVGVELNPVGDQDLRVVWHRSGIPSDAKRVDPTVQLLRPLPMGQIRGQNTSPTEDLRAAAANASSAPNLTLRQPLPAKAPADATWLNPFGPLTTKAAKAAKLEGDQVKPYALLYTYSLIIALVCGTAGLPHILVRFYTNPDGVAAKRTTMWVMILIGVFYVFPPVFGVMGRNLMPALYEGTGAKGTDKVVLELPKVLDTSAPGAAAGMTGTTPRATAAERGSLPWGSILSGITCAGAFAAFMSTFSGLLVSMTGALAHDVYGRMLRPQSSAADRMRMFKWCAALIGGVATLLGCFVEPLEINFMVGQAFAIAAASYFPLLFMSVWWRGMTIRGAATGMLVGGICALLAVALTNASNLALDKGPMGHLFSAFAPLNSFWAAHPLLRILCEQPAIWTVPLAILLMIVVSRLTAATAPSDIRLKMLVLHAPEKLGLKQDYIREHEGAGH
ncbi:MAG: hypothetical protein J0M24_27810 [Verrucomicrobia bacterium]|nr:hypothetical protein [Verrucomicrobiota bacterium]